MAQVYLYRELSEPDLCRCYFNERFTRYYATVSICCKLSVTYALVSKY